MALRPCPTCQKEISVSAFSCPHCGGRNITPKEQKQGLLAASGCTAIGCGPVILLVLIIWVMFMFSLFSS